MSDTKKPEMIDDADLDQAQGASGRCDEKKEDTVNLTRMKRTPFTPDVKRMERVHEDE